MEKRENSSPAVAVPNLPAQPSAPATEIVAAALFDLENNGPLKRVVTRVMFGRDRISYAEVKKGVEDGVYTESALSVSRKQARAALTALEQAGYVVVPVEPTENMLDAGTDVAQERGLGETDDADVAAIHRAMLSARPSPLKIE